jgi:hypothetical protein
MPWLANAAEAAEAVARLRNSRLFHQRSIATLSRQSKNLKNSKSFLVVTCFRVFCRPTSLLLFVLDLRRCLSYAFAVVF